MAVKKDSGVEKFLKPHHVYQLAVCIPQFQNAIYIFILAHNQNAKIIIYFQVLSISNSNKLKIQFILMIVAVDYVGFT